MAELVAFIVVLVLVVVVQAIALKGSHRRWLRDRGRLEALEQLLEQSRECVGLWLAWYDADRRRRADGSGMESRRRGQMIAMAEVLLFLDGDHSTYEDLRGRGLVPYTIAELPSWCGGPNEPDV